MGEAHLQLLDRMLALLERYSREVTRSQLESDPETWLKVRGALEVAAQCCIDLALTIVVKRGLGAPTSYRDAFTLLGQAGIIDSALATELQGWAGLRNVLVHVYTALDLDRIITSMGESASLRAFHAIAAGELRRP